MPYVGSPAEYTRVYHYIKKEYISKIILTLRVQRVYKEDTSDICTVFSKESIEECICLMVTYAFRRRVYTQSPKRAQCRPPFFCFNVTMAELPFLTFWPTAFLLLATYQLWYSSALSVKPENNSKGKKSNSTLREEYECHNRLVYLKLDWKSYF